MNPTLLVGHALRTGGLMLMLGCVVALSCTSYAALTGARSAAANPTPVPGTYALANRFYENVRVKRFAQAIPAGTAYLAANPGADGFAIDLAYAYVAIGRLDAARALLLGRETYLQAHPDRATVWLDIAYADSAAKRYVRAIDDLDAYLAYRPDDQRARTQRAYDVAAITPHPPDPSALFYDAIAAHDTTRAVAYGRTYLAAHPSNDVFAIDLAYAEIAAKQPEAAAAIAQSRMAYIASNPKAQALLAALFYAFKDAGQYGQARTFADKYLALQPGDNKFAVDLAYMELQQGDVAAARAVVEPRSAYFRSNPQAAKIWMDLSYKEASAKRYGAAIDDVNTYLSFDPNDAPAKAQRKAYVNDIWGGPRYQAFGYAQYEGRFNDAFFGLDQTYALAPAGRVQPYAAAYLTEDLRSGPPGSPQIYSDNALITDLGLRTHFGPFVTGFVEGGAGIGLRGQGTITDLRYGARYFEQWGQRPQPYTSVNASAAFYSRYAGNYISYYTVLHDFGGKTIRPLIGVNGGLDSHNVFGNNYLEALAGFQTGTPALTLRVVQVEGTYLTRGLNPAPKAGYSSIRASLFFGFSR